MKKYYELGYEGELLELKDDELDYELHCAVEDEIDENSYDDMLDECYDVIKIGNITFLPSQVLKECDEVAYNIGYSEYIDGIVEDYKYELDSNEYLKIGSYEFYYKDENDDEEKIETSDDEWYDVVDKDENK